MKLTLSENIRAFRKERKLTQEQLAEVLGVTTGAVYKWESGQSVPELDMIVEMADFFDTSVDVLLGYKMKDNSLSRTVERINRYLYNGDPLALTEAEKVLKKYPHSFEVVLRCAAAYLILGSVSHDKGRLRRSLELFEQSLLLISQNRDPEISEFVIYGNMGTAYIAMGEYDKGLELMKAHNAGALFSDMIGVTLAAFMHQPGEAEPYLTTALLQSLAQTINVVYGYAFVYDAQGDYRMEEEVLRWGLEMLKGIKETDVPTFMDKTFAMLLILLAHAGIRSGKAADARLSLRKAAGYVRSFDSDPHYSLISLRFVEVKENIGLYDCFGLTAQESVENMLRMLQDQDLDQLWKEVCEDV